MIDLVLDRPTTEVLTIEDVVDETYLPEESLNYLDSLLYRAGLLANTLVEYINTSGNPVIEVSAVNALAKIGIIETSFSSKISLLRKFSQANRSISQNARYFWRLYGETNIAKALTDRQFMEVLPYIVQIRPDFKDLYYKYTNKYISLADTNKFFQVDILEAPVLGGMIDSGFGSFRISKGPVFIFKSTDINFSQRFLWMFQNDLNNKIKEEITEAGNITYRTKLYGSDAINFALLMDHYVLNNRSGINQVLEY